MIAIPLNPNNVPFRVDKTSQTCKFFLGDRWIVVGRLQTTRTPEGMFMSLPDLGAFLSSRQLLEDGTMDWFNWGPILN